MSTAKTWQIQSSNSAVTTALGEQLGQNCKGGELFLFLSDLGGGKTTMVKGLALGLGSIDTTSSPSFSLSKIYNCRSGKTLHHYDFYRLSEAGIMIHELTEILDDTLAVVAIEWGDIVDEALPERRINIIIDKVGDDDNVRNISITYPPDLAYVMQGVL